AHRLRLPPAHRVLSSRREGRAHDRADRNGVERDDRSFRRRDDPHQGRSRERARAREVGAALVARGPPRRGARRAQAHAALASQDRDLIERPSAYFVTNLASAGQADFNIWMTTRSSRAASFHPPVRVDVFNTAFNDQDPYLTSDGLEFYFSTDR